MPPPPKGIGFLAPDGGLRPDFVLGDLKILPNPDLLPPLLEDLDGEGDLLLLGVVDRDL